jgi:hypothetical protein
MSSPKRASAKPVPRSRIRATPKPAGKAVVPTTPSQQAARLASDIEQGLSRGQADVLAPKAVQALMAALCRIYSAQIEAGGQFMPLPERSRVTSTDVMLTASGLLKSANLAVFELGMWQSWTGR